MSALAISHSFSAMALSSCVRSSGPDGFSPVGIASRNRSKCVDEIGWDLRWCLTPIQPVYPVRAPKLVQERVAGKGRPCRNLRHHRTTSEEPVHDRDPKGVAQGIFGGNGESHDMLLCFQLLYCAIIFDNADGMRSPF